MLLIIILGLHLQILACNYKVIATIVAPIGDSVVAILPVQIPLGIQREATSRVGVNERFLHHGMVCSVLLL